MKQGDHVKKGDLLITFELDEIKKKYDIITPVIITNSSDFGVISAVKESGMIAIGERILDVAKYEEGKS